MTVSRLNAITGQNLTLTISFREDESGLLFDPFQITKVDFLKADGQTVIQTISSGSITRLSIGKYAITVSALALAGLYLDRWSYRLVDGGPTLTSIEVVNIAQSTAFPPSTESSDALSRNSAVSFARFSLQLSFGTTSPGNCLIHLR